MELYKIGLKQTERNKKYKNNFLSATLHCLINIEFLSKFLYEFNKRIDNKKLNAYKTLLEEIKKTNNNCISLENYENILLNNINEKDYNPQFLLKHLLEDFKGFMLNKYEKTEISDNICIELQNVKECVECKNVIEEQKKEELYLAYDLSKENNVYDCIESYLKIKENEYNIIYCEQCKKKTQHKIKRILRNLPEVLIIFVDYGKDKNVEIDKEFEFNEYLDDFSSIKANIHSNHQNKKYYLSSLICARQLNEKKEHFHTFCRESKNSKYFCFNGEIFHEVENINNKLKKEKIDLKDKKERFPYILIYKSYYD